MTSPRKVGVTLGELLGRDAGEFIDLLRDELGLDREEPPPPTPEGRGAMSIDEVAEWAGVSRGKVIEATASGDLRSLKLGRRRLIRVADAQAWLDALLRQTDGQAS